MLLQKREIHLENTQIQDSDLLVYWKSSKQIGIEREGVSIFFWHLERLESRAPFSRERNSNDHPRLSNDMACRIFRVIARDMDCTIEKVSETDTKIEYRFVKN